MKIEIEDKMADKLAKAWTARCGDDGFTDAENVCMAIESAIDMWLQESHEGVYVRPVL